MPWVIWFVVIVFIIYPLGIGPAAVLHKACPPARPAIEAAYKPMTLLADRCPPFRNMLISYVSLWGVR